MFGLIEASLRNVFISTSGVLIGSEEFTRYSLCEELLSLLVLPHIGALVMMFSVLCLYLDRAIRHNF